jgi:hypothetical protein
MRFVMVHINTEPGEDAAPFTAGRGCRHMPVGIGKQVGQVGSKHYVTFQLQVWDSMPS